MNSTNSAVLIEPQVDAEKRAAYERCPSSLSDVFFKPWVGKEYWNSGFLGKRVLILGESHYKWDEAIEPGPDTTCWCVAEQVKGERYRYKFWTNIVISFLNRHPTLSDKYEFWNQVAFYNFVQSSVGFGARVRPTKEMWAISQPAFLKVLDVLCPHVVFALGHQLWRQMPPEETNWNAIVEDSVRMETCWYRLSSGERVLACNMKHPSAGFSGWKWYPAVMKAISLAKAK